MDFVRNGGHLSPAVPAVEKQSRQQLTLGKLRDRYIAVHEESLEGTTLQGMKIHFAQLTRVLGEGRFVQQLTLADLQEYVKTRTRAPGIRSRKLSAAMIRKEIVTLKTAWNWAARMELVEGSLPSVGLRYPKISEKPHFQTRTEIQQQIDQGHLTPGEERELWDALYLTLPEIEKLLKHVSGAAVHPWIYPLFCTAAHTGARRSELLRAKVSDVDLQNDQFVIHERKRVRCKLTSRRVPLSPFLKQVLSGWMKVHPGGNILFAKPSLVRGRTSHAGVKALTPSEARDHFQRTLAGSDWSVLRGWHVFRHSTARIHYAALGTVP